MAKRTLIKNAQCIITCDNDDTLIEKGDILIEDERIKAIGHGLDDSDATIIDGCGKFVYPGLVNSHHHLLQAFTRNIPAIQSSQLFDWLLYLYNVWLKVTPDSLYYSSMVAMSEFVKYGGTTLFDQHFAFPKGAGKEMLDRQFDAAKELGLRFHGGRSSFNRGKKDGGLPPDDLIETCEETLSDCQRLIDKFHDDSPLSMAQVVVSPCSPFSVNTEIMLESAKLARANNVRLHTHLVETIDEENYCLEVYGKRPLAWAESCNWVGPGVWYAHGIHFTDEELKVLEKTGTGVAHCPVSNMKLSSGIAKIPQMLKAGIPVGLAVDGCGSNDGSNLMAEIRSAYLLHRLNNSVTAPTGLEILKLATIGSATLLGRQKDIGSLEEGKAADLFMIDVDHLEQVGALMDPGSFLATVGYSRPVSLTMINGRIVYKEGELLTVDEDKIKKEARKSFENMYS